MKVYTNFGIRDEKALNSGTVKSNCRITSAKILPYANDGEDVLGLKMMEDMTDESFGYGLVGKGLYEDFKKDMKIKNGKIERLVGKKVIGFVNENEPVLQGIGLIK